VGGEIGVQNQALIKSKSGQLRAKIIVGNDGQRRKRDQAAKSKITTDKIIGTRALSH